MPHISRRSKFIIPLKDISNKHLKARAIRATVDNNMDKVEDATDVFVVILLKNAQEPRYLFIPSMYCRSPIEVCFKTDLNKSGTPAIKDNSSEEENEADNLVWINNKGFLQKYRVSQQSFGHILEKNRRSLHV